MNELTKRQPLLPQISMRWYFVAMLVVAILLTTFLRSSLNQYLEIALILTGVSALLFLALSAITFAMAYVIGATDKLAQQAQQKTESPFAYDSLPPQIVPPHPNE
ncbi:MAG TPA: hypothetical protein DCF63_08870 [Planctomycetaceae bacterium]|nr:hypothetical protein [Planctomycetaceae bacterium]